LTSAPEHQELMAERQVLEDERLPALEGGGQEGEQLDEQGSHGGRRRSRSVPYLRRRVELRPCATGCPARLARCGTGPRGWDEADRFANGRHRRLSPHAAGPPSAFGFAYRRYANSPRDSDPVGPAQGTRGPGYYILHLVY
jgi:hypothetical protein